MKKIIGLTVAVLCFLAVTSLVYAEDKVGFVDLGKVFDEYQKTKDYDVQLTKKQDSKIKEREQLVKDIKDMQNKLSALNDKEKESSQKTIDNKIASLGEFDQNIQTDLRKERDEMMKEILAEIEKVIKEYAQAEGFKLIFNDRILLYGSDTMDVTNAIVSALNSKYTKPKQ